MNVHHPDNIVPVGTANLTALPTEDLRSESPSKTPWVTLHAETTTATSEAFWYVLNAFTHKEHWNRTLYNIQLESQSLLNNETREVRRLDQKPAYQTTPSKESTYIGVRNLCRKTPSPVGGENGKPCFDAVEWAALFIENVSSVDEAHLMAVDEHVRLSKEMDSAVFGLCIPQRIINAGNPRALRYWPFQYPKARCYRFSYRSINGIEVSNSDSGQQEGESEISQKPIGVVSYAVQPLGDESYSLRHFDEMKNHLSNGAKKLVTMLRKRLEKYDPQIGASTYIKRVLHDALITEQEYRAKYDVMKQRYSFWVGCWNECTDPVKFVYEEMSIAAYLCALWQKEREKDGSQRMQSFIDCGCGNGFLVYLLMSEGHPGIGVDLQKRRIWQEYPPKIRDSLFHKTMDPRTFDVSDYDWVLGNHADELCPWIPSMAARAQRKIEKTHIEKPPITLNDIPSRPIRRAQPQFFILPCCFYDFDGKKVSFGNTRRTLGVSAAGGIGKYEQYYRWIARTARAFGFTVEYENLRIPSTKYVSLLGRFVEFEERISPTVIREMTGLMLLDARLSHSW